LITLAFEPSSFGNEATYLHQNIRLGTNWESDDSFISFSNLVHFDSLSSSSEKQIFEIPPPLKTERQNSLNDQ